MAEAASRPFPALCHSERGEEPLHSVRAGKLHRSFAALRMTTLFGRLVRTLHLIFHALGELLDFLSLLDHFEGKDVLVGFVDVGFEFGGEFQKLFRVVLERRDSFLRGPLLRMPCCPNCQSR